MTIASIFPELVKDGLGFYRKSYSQNNFGETVGEYPDTPHLVTSGALRQLSGSKRFVASVHGYDADFRLYVDAPADIETGDRMIYDSTRFDVKAVNDVMELGETLQIDLEWVKNDGDQQLPAGS